MDWNKASAIAGIGTFILTVIIVGLMVSPMLPGHSFPTGALRQTVGWAPIIVLAAAIVLAAWLHWKASASGSQNSTVTSFKSGPIQPPRLIINGEPASTFVGMPVANDADDDRIFLDNSAYELEKPFSNEEFTSYQAKKLTADYLGKWVRWVVPIANVAEHPNSVTISANLPEKGTLAIYVRMSFEASDKDKILHLSKGTSIKVEGKVADISRREVDLEHCRLISVNPLTAV